MSSHLLIINSISNTLSIPHLFSGLPRQHCKTIRLAFHLKSLQLSSQPAFAVLVRKTFGKSLMLNFEADVAIFIEGMCWSEIQWVFFMQVLIEIRALGVVFGFFCFPSLQKISWAYYYLLHKLLSASKVTREIKISNKGGIQSIRNVFSVTDWRCRAERLIHLEMYSMPRSN